MATSAVSATATTVPTATTATATIAATTVSDSSATLSSTPITTLIASTTIKTPAAPSSTSPVMNSNPSHHSSISSSSSSRIASPSQGVMQTQQLNGHSSSNSSSNNSSVSSPPSRPNPELTSTMSVSGSGNTPRSSPALATQQNNSGSRSSSPSTTATTNRRRSAIGNRSSLPPPAPAAQQLTLNLDNLSNSNSISSISTPGSVTAAIDPRTHPSFVEFLEQVPNSAQLRSELVNNFNSIVTHSRQQARNAVSRGTPMAVQYLLGTDKAPDPKMDIVSHCWNGSNLPKNRYRDIVPFDANRVIISATSINSFKRQHLHTDFINASYIQLPGNIPGELLMKRDELGNVRNADLKAEWANKYRHGYIATQGPLESTVNDFWRMIVDHNIPVIIALAQIMERNKLKCFKYFPTEPGSEFITADGFLKVKLEKSIKHDGFIERVIKIDDLRANSAVSSRSRVVYQLHIEDWPDYGAPQQVLPIIGMVVRMHQILRDASSSSSTSSSSSQNRSQVRHQPGHYQPLYGVPVVHCSAGVGRTGTFIVIDLLLALLCDPLFVDYRGNIILALIRHLRTQRVEMVQSTAQLYFICNALLYAQWMRKHSTINNVLDLIKHTP
ncbi:hypothetical protein GQ42DRAFT_162941 [Ramicandelaber brevisporus]|nr:hypothetical protein GQ42DRAFT_162941 [Ramicandelaber brevisporus]